MRQFTMISLAGVAAGASCTLATNIPDGDSLEITRPGTRATYISRTSLAGSRDGSCTVGSLNVRACSTEDCLYPFLVETTNIGPWASPVGGTAFRWVPAESCARQGCIKLEWREFPDNWHGMVPDNLLRSCYCDDACTRYEDCCVDYQWTCKVGATVDGFFDFSKLPASAPPTPEPTPEPTPDPTPEPTPDPTPEPTPDPTPEPTKQPTPSSTSVSDVSAGNPCLPAVQTKIVGGSETGVREFPFMVSLQEEGYGHFCGGTLIGDRWVLTAAHCTVDATASELVVKVGVHALSDDEDACVEVLQVKRIVNHPQYDDQTVVNDIALLELASPSAYPPVALSEGAGEAAGTTLMAAGWGQTAEGDGGYGGYGSWDFDSGDWGSWDGDWGSWDGDWGSWDYDDFSADWYSGFGSGSSDALGSEDWYFWKAAAAAAAKSKQAPLKAGLDTDVLLEVDVTVFSNQQCNAAYGGNGDIKSSMICAGETDAAKDTCYGDSGGPLFLRSPENGQIAQVGITSWGAECGGVAPGVYTRVSSFLDSFVCPTANIACK